MKIKKYEVSDMKEALRMIKEDMGPDAVILSTRKVMKSNNFGLFARPVLEVTAAIDYEGFSRNKQKQTPKKREDSNYSYDNYPSAYTSVAKKQVKKHVPQNLPKEKSTYTKKSDIHHTGYEAYNKQNLSEFKNKDDDYLADIDFERGFSEEDLLYPQADEQIDRKKHSSLADKDEALVYMPTESDDDRPNIKETKKDKHIKDKEKSKKKDAQTQDEVSATQISNVIKAVGLDKFTNLLDDIGEIKKQLSNMQSSMSDNLAIDLSPKTKAYHSLFLKNGVDEIISYRFFKKIDSLIGSDNKDLTPTQIKSMILEEMPLIIPIEKNYQNIITNKIVALAGPTGVGKTTTIAKIAATMALKYNKKVCLITVDNFRIGAVEQLKTYAEIVNLPLYVSSSPEELARVIMKVKDTYDSVLIDSMGRSQFDVSQIAAISDFFKVDSRIITVLALSMASNHAELDDTFERYEILKPDYLIFTKLDETKYFGPLINIPVKKKVPLILVTTGQNVPDDMEIPDGKKIARKMLQDIHTQWSDK